MATDYAPRVGAASTPAELLEELGAILADRYAYAERLLIERIAKVVRAGIDDGTIGELNERLLTVQALRDYAQTIAAGLAPAAAAAGVLALAAEQGRAAAARELAPLGLPRDGQISPQAARAVAALALDLTSDLRRMEARITRWAPDVFQQVVSYVAPGVITGAETLSAAQARAASALLSRGVPAFQDAAGRTWRPGTYAEMATRAAVQRAWTDAHLGQVAAVGRRVVTIIGGRNTCAECAPWIGKPLTIDGAGATEVEVPHATDPTRTVTVVCFGSIADARNAGWGHPNCRCVPSVYFPGSPQPVGSTYDPQAEQDRDRLRELERGVRDWKRRTAAALTDDESLRSRRKVREWQGRIREHVAATGMVRRRYREQLSFSDGRAPIPSAPLSGITG